MTAEPLAGRWRALSPGAAEATVTRVYTDLVARYADPQRAYHTLDHIADCLGHFDAVRHLAAWPASVCRSTACQAVAGDVIGVPFGRAVSSPHEQPCQRQS